MIFKEIKQICIVGNSGNMIGSNLGKKIDGQECIARFSIALPEKNPRLKKDIGTKTDIYIRRGDTPWVDMVPNIKYVFARTEKRIVDKLKAMGVKEVYPIYLNEKEARYDKEHQKILRDFRKETGYDTKNPTIGLGFILLCLRHKIPEINICGFTTNENYNPNGIFEFSMAPDYKYSQAEQIAKGGHNFKKERNYISRLLKEKKINYLK